MFAVIELQGHQYIVRNGDQLVVDKLELESSTYVCDHVLLVAQEDGSMVTVGKPYVAGMNVSFDVITDFQKGEKTRVLKFKRKNRYQRIIGFRPHQTVLVVTAIGEHASEPKAKTESKKPATKTVTKKTVTKKVTKKAE
ncbi:MAG TPA: 50S ribosomal protein L21 [Candidatus Absconditabacterales bacterium]|nr:50S ribosomal protein L21 [Candidatus Absconditabacterales bacterium]HNG97248.1 50S ribosomal protein L21 [Candidatus Absconditabacterales bacterium]